MKEPMNFPFSFLLLFSSTICKRKELFCEKINISLPIWLLSSVYFRLVVQLCAYYITCLMCGLLYVFILLLTFWNLEKWDDLFWSIISIICLGFAFESSCMWYVMHVMWWSNCLSSQLYVWVLLHVIRRMIRLHESSADLTSSSFLVRCYRCLK